MKGFLIFFSLTAMLIGGFLYFKITHPTDTMIVRTGAYWTVYEHNVTK